MRGDVGEREPHGPLRATVLCCSLPEHSPGGWGARCKGHELNTHLSACCSLTTGWGSMPAGGAQVARL